MRVAFVVVALGAWEALSASGLLFRDVVPSLAAIGRALAKVLSSPDFYANLGVTAQEIGVAVVIGGPGRAGGRHPARRESFPVAGVSRHCSCISAPLRRSSSFR
jgi:hypothetical protein